ncbi:hypothetical protein ACRW9N_10710 [Listeria aquatica]|uniref:hypothetical protein n=1 Tax=Listeria aquatica TaxID=1494960 RepID=UPI003EF792C3
MGRRSPNNDLDLSAMQNKLSKTIGKEQVKLNNDIDLTNTNPQTSSPTADIQIDEQKVKEQKKGKTSSNTKRKSFSFEQQTPETINKTFVVYADLMNEIESIVTDQETGRKIPGTKGFISKLVNNGIRRELVELGILDQKELDKNEQY